jgi:hypothetical protein
MSGCGIEPHEEELKSFLINVSDNLGQLRKGREWAGNEKTKRRRKRFIRESCTTCVLLAL